MKVIYPLIFLICLCGCFGNSDNPVNGTGEKQFGLHIENGPRQGMQYFDTTNTEYNYRYYTMTITNDSLIPIHLDINFSPEKADLKDKSKPDFFLLPRHLTPEEQHFDQGGMPKELKRFLDVGIYTPVYFNKTLKPTEKCVLTFGALTNRKDFDPTTPFDTKLLIVAENTSAISVKFKVNETLIIPCGHISYPNQ